MQNYVSRRSDEEIETLKLLVSEAVAADETRFPKRTFEQGVRATLLWLFEGARSPMNG